MALFLTALVVCPLAVVNLWPFSSWELFSHLRTDRETSWEAIAVTRSGRQRHDPLGSVPHGYRGFGFIMRGFSTRPATSRDAVCAAWLREAEAGVAPGTKLLRIYRLEWRLSARRGNRTAPPRRSLAWVCSAKGVREVG
ncbi:MAG: hypothetical protein ACXVEM_00370 [Gaiellaceae bacterium]